MTSPALAATADRPYRATRPLRRDPPLTAPLRRGVDSLRTTHDVQRNRVMCSVRRNTAGSEQRPAGGGGGVDDLGWALGIVIGFLVG
jgi:hypothetical protein